jgi:transposase-like protein
MGTRSIGRLVPLHYHTINAMSQCLSIELLRCEIQAEQRIHPTQLRDWKKQALEGLPNLFADSSEAARATALLEHKQDELYAEIGRLTTQVGWLKKIWP